LPRSFRQVPKGSALLGVAQIVTQAPEHADVFAFYLLAVAVMQGGDFEQGREMDITAGLGIPPLFELVREKAFDAFERGNVAGVQRVEAGVLALQSQLVALENQVFLGAHIVVEAGLGKPQAARNVLQRGGA
jgi:hypothetical protein